MKQLSKSDYVLFLRHPAWLWLKKNDKDKLPEPDANLQARFDEGNLFETYAEQLFHGGVRIGFDNHQEYEDMPKRTKQVLDEGADIIFQGRFAADRLTCIVDVMKRVEGNTFDLIEIKASTKAKTEHEYDLAFQVYVIEKVGYQIRNISVAHVNNSFVRSGDIDPKKITTITDVTDKVKKKLPMTEQHAQEALRVIDLPKPPDMSPRFAKLGSFNDWLEIFKNLNGPFPGDSIYNLVTPGVKGIAKLEDMHIESIKDIPDDFSLKPKQAWQVAATKKGQRIIDNEKIKDFINNLQFPLYFLDYETLSSLIPAYDGLKPYQQVPFQYSLHILDSPDAKLKQVEYLHMDNTNPAKALSEKLISDIGDKGSVLVWYQPFEKGRNDLLGELVPERREAMAAINDRIVDLMTPFAQGLFVDKDFMGSASIKNVLPALMPDLSYKELEIQEGGSAQRIWMETVVSGKNTHVKEQIEQNLLDYCRLDTKAMVEIYYVLASVN